MGQRVRAGVNRARGVGFVLAPVILLVLMRATPAAQTNPVVLENQQPGSGGWEPDTDLVGTDAVGQIKGYASAVSVNKGNNITFYVSVNPAQTYTLDLYRVGWYQGLGGRLMQHIGPLNGVRQPGCPTDPTYGTIECQWAPAYTLTVPTTWTSGIYIGTLINAQGYKNYLTFVVRDDSRTAALIYQQPIATYQADNNWPNDGQTGKSTYDYRSYGPVVPTTGLRSASKVSFDRPYLDTGLGDDFNGDTAEINFVRWLERSGYDVVYSTDVDTHANGSRLLNYRGFLTAGHDEYWSKQMFDSVEAAREAGVNLGFFTGNSIYWQMRMEPSSTGTPNRVLVCYKDEVLDPVANKSLTTVLWRGDPVNRPEQTLMGVQYTVSIPPQDNQGFFPSFVVQNSSHWVYAGTGFANGTAVRGLVGYEVDRSFSNEPSPPNVPGTYTLLSNSSWGGGVNDHSNSSIYQAPSGAWVYTTGSMNWNYGLDAYGHGFNLVDSRIQRTAANVLDRFVSGTVQPAPTVNVVTPSNGSTSGGTAITIAGTNFLSGATVSIGGTAATGVAVLNSTTITATTPAHSAGAADVSVTNTDGRVGALSNGFTYVSTAPAINNLAPSDGPTSGGTTITLTGINYAAGATVTVGGTAATGVTVVNSTTIRAVTPAHAAGTVNVTVTNTDGQSGTITAGFVYLMPAPTITGVAPASGPTTGGTTITVTGTNFAAGATVSFGGSAATGVTVVNATTITAITPLHAPGTVGVTVTNTDAQSATLANSFTYTVSAPAPTVTGVSPTSGSGGSTIAITGTGFAAGAAVTVGGTAATGVTVVNSTTITATAPAHAAGVVSVTVTNPDVQSATLANAFTYLAPPANVAFDAVGPAAGGAAASAVSTLSWTHTVTPTGSNLLLTAAVAVGKSPDTGLSLAVTYNGVPMTSAGLVHANNRADGFAQLFYLVNPATGTKTVQVTLSGGTAALEGGSVSFTGVDQTTPIRNVATSAGSSTTPRVTVTSAPGDLVVDAMVTGCTGTITSIQTLRWLKQQNCATAGGNGAQSTAAGAASVTMGYTVPNDYWGMIGVDLVAVSTPAAFDFALTNGGNRSVVRGGAVTNAVTATLLSGTTQAATFSVSGLPAGVTGSFDTTSCAPTCGPTLTLDASTSATLGTVPVVVTATAGTVTHTTSFNLTVTAPAPTVTNVTPASGSTGGGTALTITGTGFAAGATVSVGGSAATGIAVVNATTITATTPAHAAAAAAVTVTNADAQSGSLANAFTYSAPAPTVTNVAPASGSTGGGTAMTISGTGFAAGATVSVGGSAATGVGVVNSTTITATAPAHAAGAVSVTVTNADAQSGTLANAFTYSAPAPTVTNVAPASGSTAGGTAMTISGTGFAAGATVSVGGSAATGITVVNATTITATTPAHAAGAVAVTVTNADAQSGTLANAFTYGAPAPTVTNVAPASGSTGGGTAMTISGTGFAAGATVSVGGSAATGITVVNATTITATTPAHAAGAVAVTVTNADAQSGTLANAFAYLAPAPTVTNVTPASGSTPGGTAVTITGTGFAAGATVSVGGSAATGITVVNETTITATTPAHAAGAVSVTVTNADAQSGTLANAFTYIAPAPTVTNVAPASGSTGGGTAMTISGTGFAAGATVSVGGSAATGITVVNATTITATTPAHAAGAVAVTVTNSDAQSGTKANAFTYLAPVPTVTNVAPASGSTGGGTAITITGTGFAAGATVSVGGTAATGATVVDATTITATTPAHVAGAGAVAVTNPDTQSGSLANAFTYIAPPPAVTSVTPTSGPTVGGTTITITGTGFAAGATVSVGGSAATGITVVNATTITATAPAHAAGAVTLTVTNSDAQSGSLESAFTYVTPAPTVTNVSPTSGPTAGGTAITITGTGFAAGATVSLGGTAASDVTVVTATTITATTPAHAVGAVAVTVTNPDAQSGTKANAFTYLAPAPTVTSVAPTSGLTAGGTAITITGTGFAAGATVSVGGTAATGATVVDATTITATTPAHVAGAVAVAVTNPDTQSGSLANAFTYIAPPPAVTSVTPTSGPTVGGTTITITGTGFAAGATVSVGGTNATGVTVANATKITATTPAHVAGAVSVTVTNSDAQYGTLADAFTYVTLAPTVTSVAPSSGPTAGGTAISISGTGFGPGATVSVGGTAATGVTVVNPTTITATTPAQAAGAVSVTVTNIDAQSGTLAGGFTYGAAIARVGGWTEIQSAVNAATATVTVPSDATMMVVFVTGYRSGNYFSTGTVSIGGASMTAVAAESNNSAFKGAAFYRALPPTGAQTLSWDWAGTAIPSDGVILAYGFYKNDGGALRDAEGKQSASGAAITSKTLTASPGDLLVSWRFGFWPYVNSSFTFSWTSATKVADFDVAAGYRKATASVAESSPSGSQTVTGSYGAATDGGLITLVIKGSGG